MSTEELLFYLRKYQNGELALSQIAERLNMSETELRERFNSLGGSNKQTLNG